MSYILDQTEEFNRLQKQNTDPEFDPEFDLKSFKLNQPQSILDLGCGSGVMTHLFHRHFPKASVIGVDASEIRVQQLNAHNPHPGQVQFRQANACALPFEPQTFDTILMRYVAQHLSGPSLKIAFKEALRCLKPNGKLLIVDVDGYLETLYPMGEMARKTLDLLSGSGILDLRVGRKLPSFLSEAGFSSVDWKMDLISFQDAARDRSVQRTMERIDGARGGLAQMGYSDQDFEKFKSEILSGLASLTSVCYLNRFYVTATKGAGMSLVG